MTAQSVTAFSIADIMLGMVGRPMDGQPQKFKRLPACHDRLGLRRPAKGTGRLVWHRPMATLAILAFTAAAALSIASAQAAEPRPGHYRYSIRHTLFGEIGSQSIHLARVGQDTVVTMEARVKIELLFITLLRLHTRTREVWRDGRMIAFHGRSEEDGDVITIKAKAAHEGMVIEGPKGKTIIPGRVALTNPWNSTVLDVPIVIEPPRGSLLSIRNRPGSRQSIEARGRNMKAREHTVTGDMEASVWFADDGSLARMEFFKAGGWVTIALESFTQAQTPSRDLVAQDHPLP